MYQKPEITCYDSRELADLIGPAETQYAVEEAAICEPSNVQASPLVGDALTFGDPDFLLSFDYDSEPGCGWNLVDVIVEQMNGTEIDRETRFRNDAEANDSGQSWEVVLTGGPGGDISFGGFDTFNIWVELIDTNGTRSARNVTPAQITTEGSIP
jgi:hypothetical protein